MNLDPAQLAAVTRALPDPLTVTDTEGKIVFVNGAFLETYGYDEDEVAGRRIDFIVAPSDRAIVQRVREMTRAGGWTGTVMNVRKDGTEFPVSLKTVPLRGASGKIIGGIGIARDVTGQRRLRGLSSALESLSEMVVITDLDRKIIYANDAIEKVLGYRPEEVIGREAKEFFEGIPGNPPDLAERVAEESVNDIWQGELLNRKKDGSIIHVHVTLNWIKDENGDLIGCVGNTVDITERKRAEERIERAAREWQGTFDAMIDLVSILDKDFNFVKANRAFMEFFGLKEEDIIGRSCHELVQRLKSPVVSCPHEEAIRYKRPHVSEVYDERFKKTLLVSVSPLFDDNGEFLGTVHVARNITGFRESQKRLEERNRELEIIEKAALAREFRIKELRDEIKELRAKLADRDMEI